MRSVFSSPVFLSMIHNYIPHAFQGVAEGNSAVNKNASSEAQPPGVKSQLWHLLAVWPQAC